MDAVKGKGNDETIVLCSIDTLLVFSLLRSLLDAFRRAALNVLGGVVVMCVCVCVCVCVSMLW